MTLSVTGAPLAERDADLFLLPCPEDASDALIDEWAEALGSTVRRAADDFDGETGEALSFYPDATAPARAALIGYGPADEVDAEALRSAAAAGAKIAQEREIETVAFAAPAVNLDIDTVTQALVEGFMLGAYRFTEHKTDDPTPAPHTILLHTGDAEAGHDGAARGRALAEATSVARSLVNRSPDRKTATLFANAIRDEGAAHGYDVDVWYQDQIAEANLGGLLAVNLGSFEPPTFSILSWHPENAVNEQPIVLVGKGVVFDTGGLSLKPTKDSMDFMKADMGGAAAVVGAFNAIADLDLPLHVIGLVPATDNRPGNKAYVPGDVIEMHSGSTVEVLNTDAEGRMLLADALSFAKQYDPDLVIDLATLTGAAVVALGDDAAAVMASESDDGSAERLYAIQRAGERTGDRVHPLPMYKAYRKLLDSNVADIKNVGGRAAGAITAGKFLEHFIDYPWLHLDIAGPAFIQKSKTYRPKGGTGFGVRLLADFLSHHVETY